MPTSYDRDYEERLLSFCAELSFDRQKWSTLGPPFFVAGLAVMLASVPGYDRARLLALAERLYPGGSTQPEFARWLELSPLRPGRFLPMLAERTRHAA